MYEWNSEYLNLRIFTSINSSIDWYFILLCNQGIWLVIKLQFLGAFYPCHWDLLWRVAIHISHLLTGAETRVCKLLFFFLIIIFDILWTDMYLFCIMMPLVNRLWSERGASIIIRYSSIFTVVYWRSSCFTLSFSRIISYFFAWIYSIINNSPLLKHLHDI